MVEISSSGYACGMSTPDTTTSHVEGLAAHDLSRYVGRRVVASIDGVRQRCRIIAVGAGGLSLSVAGDRGRHFRPREVARLGLCAQS